MTINYRLSEGQLEQFDRDGFLGPLNAFMPPRECDQLAQFFMVVNSEKRVNPLYGRYSTRDWHLLNAGLGRLFSHPAVAEPVKQILGEDLILWRSKLFWKAAGERELGWHQEWGAFNGEEIGNDVPGLQPSRAAREPWNVTVWFALCDIDADMGPIRFIRGSHRKRYPIAMVDMPESGFFHEPFLGITNKDDLVNRAKTNRLVLDIDTSRFFEGVDIDQYMLEELKKLVVGKLSHMKAAVTLPFDYNPADLISLENMRKGQFVLFYERTMHGSSANNSPRDRVAVNCRLTRGDTLVYPGRLKGDFIDGSNLDVRKHRCIVVSGRGANQQNAYGELPKEDLSEI